MDVRNAVAIVAIYPDRSWETAFFENCDPLIRAAVTAQMNNNWEAELEDAECNADGLPEGAE